MDEIAKYNHDRWEELAKAGVMYSIPELDLDENSARDWVDPQGMLGDLTGKDVLCLAGGGGQQSAAFGFLGANVTVLDLSETQLERDREAAVHYGHKVETHQGDMRDLSRFGEDAFDVVLHAHSLNFVSDARKVFREVARVLKVRGKYRLHCSNPFTHSVIDDWKTNEEGYLLRERYLDGVEVIPNDPYWDVETADGSVRRVLGPREFRHSLSTLVNGLVEQGFAILGVWEGTNTEPDPEPGTWEHFKSIAPPWLTFLSAYRPDSSAT